VVTALATLTVRVPVPVEVLPDPLYRLGVPDMATATSAVRVLCAVVNAELDNLLADVDTGVSR
jgi:hypothetical protein